MQQIVKAVNFCHANQIIHRDIKPHNILLSEPNSLHQLKLIDFGLASRIKNSLNLTDEES